MKHKTYNKLGKKLLQLLTYQYRKLNKQYNQLNNYLLSLITQEQPLSLFKMVVFQAIKVEDQTLEILFEEFSLF
jgi:hypothetical protein